MADTETRSPGPVQNQSHAAGGDWDLDSNLGSDLESNHNLAAKRLLFGKMAVWERQKSIYDTQMFGIQWKDSATNC